MLDTTTKRRIDTARDLLVGKVPDPKSQVEQITIALIYKFMDDIDAESEEFGGTRTFFADDFARFGWAKLMHSGLGGHEILNLYAEAITRMPENPGIPPLFRDIFKNAFLPYRDPETLRDFLKVIDEFTYDHSERLGDAFEYLLSVLGSQGDAGQFRTPRHIIDFIVAVIDPQKNDTILDPACGTAGFLISSYKHILKANTDANDHSTLTPDERGRLATNFQGYDISPDMVRLSLVNMYLHGFAAPHIFEYDTLTSQDRWNAYADVILANPPFMSPKGGIRPHNRFSVQSKRSEVLFVDYIAEHLTSNGRAGIIVPEGIIFQSQTAYKQLRKMLVEDYLVAVVSLPAGVFQPYSGVKTSILILDKVLAKKADRIAFFKVENDGFDLGAQRRAIDKNDLPQVRKELGEYLERLRAGESEGDFQATLMDRVAEPGTEYTRSEPTLTHGLVAGKEKVATDGDYNLSGERYRESKTSRSQKWPRVELGEVIQDKPRNGYSGKPVPYPTDLKVLSLSATTSGTLDISQHKYLDENISPDSPYRCRRGDIYLQRGNTKELVGTAALFDVDESNFVYPDLMIRVRADEVKITSQFLLCVLQSDSVREYLTRNAVGSAGSMPKINQKIVKQIPIPLPPLEMQREIVAEIEGYQKVIDGARAVVENYRPHIAIDPEWPMVEIGDLTKPEYGFTASAEDDGDARFIRITDIAEDGTLRQDGAKFITLTSESREALLARGDILVARTGATYGKTMLFDEGYPAVFASYLIRLRFPPDRVHPGFYWAFTQSDAYWNQAKTLVTGGGQPQFNGNALRQVKIPMPPLTIQQEIVTGIQVEQSLVNTNRELIERFERKIRGVVGRVWGEKAEVGRVEG